MNADFPGQYHWEVQHRGEVAVYKGQLRKFLGIPTSELTELTFFVRGRIHVAHAMTELDQVRLLEEAQRMRGFNGAYQLVNGPINPALGARYQPNRIHGTAESATLILAFGEPFSSTSILFDRRGSAPRTRRNWLRTRSIPRSRSFSSTS
jgi:hypothetical protein